MIKVKDEKGLVRDPNSKAILRVDPTQLHDYRRKKQMMKNLYADASRVSEIETQLARQADQIDALVTLVQQLIKTPLNKTTTRD